MATRRPARRPRKAPAPDLETILAQFHHAIATVAVVCRSLMHHEPPDAAQECTVLLGAVEALNKAYDALDRATLEARSTGKIDTTRP